MQAILKIFIGLPLAILTSIYLAFIMTRVIIYYNIPTTLTFVQILGIIYIYRLITIKVDNKEDVSSFYEWTILILKYVVLISSLWGVAYLLSLIIK